MKIQFRYKGVLLILGAAASISFTSADLVKNAQVQAPSTVYYGYPSPDLVHTGSAALSLEATERDSSTFKKYREPLDRLVQHFESRDMEIKPLLVDPRFEVYERLTTTFTQSAERVAPTLDNYKDILGYANKRDNIASFMLANMDDLIEAETTYDIPRYVIAAIIGVESDFGRVVGSYNPFNAYVSMIAQEYRDDFALAQLEELLLFTNRYSIDVLELKSSYAGAVSYAQFIPYSLNRWFVGTDFYDMGNNIASVANYLAHFKAITGTIEGAVYRYNPSDLYTGAVMDLAKEAEELIADS